MDKIKAKQQFEQLKGIEIEGITIEAPINNGKSAAVYRGKKGNAAYAIKIFDSELVERFGVEIQQQRIEHELSLKGHKINNLIEILGGGHTMIKNEQYFYLIMKYIKGINLKEYIENSTITVDFIVKVINTLLDVSEKLLQLEHPLAHRDIKPENIMVTTSGDIIIMDLGVLKIIGVPSITDINEKQFLGTLRYAPPEFLTRQEEDSKDGWRAINIYQIGAVLHDLIMKKELFEGIEPYTNLVVGIKEDMPLIISKNFHPDMVQLARNMLQKDWHKRLKLASIDTVKNTLARCLLPEEQVNLYNDIKKNALLIQADLEKIEAINRAKAEKEKIMLNIHYAIWNIIDECFNKREISEIIKKIDTSNPFTMGTVSNTMPMSKFRFYRLDGKFEYGFVKPVFILLMVENDENSYGKISILGIIPNMLSKKDIEKPEVLMYEFFSKERKYPSSETIITNPPELNISLSHFFDGIIEIEDANFKKLLDTAIANILERIVQVMKPDVQSELERRKTLIESGQGISVAISRSPGTIFVNLSQGRQLTYE